MSAVAEFFEKIKATHATGEAHEHSYRPAHQGLFEALSEGVSLINLKAPVPGRHCEGMDA